MLLHEEKYLDKMSIKSFKSSYFQNLELILIDDVSTDRSRSIANSFSDIRIVHIFNKDNQGL